MCEGRFQNDINWFSHAICSSRQSRLFTPPFWLARYRSEMTTFLRRFPARRNRTVHSGLILELFAQWVIYFDWKKKFAGLGGVKGGSHEYILHILSHTVQSKDFTAASRMRYMLVPPRLLGPRRSPGFSMASVHSWGRSLAFPRLRQFVWLKFFCQMNFCKETKFLLKQFQIYIKNLWMLLRFLCPDTLLAILYLLSCWLSHIGSCPDYPECKLAS